MGEYSAAEFENSTADDQADWVLRASRRKLFIEDACEGTLNSSMKDDEAEVVKLAMDASRRKILQYQTPDSPQQTEESTGVTSPSNTTAVSATKEGSEGEQEKGNIAPKISYHKVSRENAHSSQQNPVTRQESERIGRSWGGRGLRAKKMALRLESRM